MGANSSSASSRTIHQVNESVTVEEIDTLHRLYLETLRRLFG